MRLSAKKVGWIVTLVAVALGGLVVLQASLLSYARTLKEQAFRRNVMTALGQISNALTTGEALTIALATDSTNQVSIEAHMQAITLAGDTTIRAGRRDMMFICPDSLQPPPFHTTNEGVHYSLQTPQHVILKLIDPSTGEETVYVDSLQDAGEHQVQVDIAHMPGSGYSWQYATDSDSQMFRFEAGQHEVDSTIWLSGGRKMRMITAVFDDLLEAEREPVEERLAAANIDSIIAVTLEENGLDLDYVYGVMVPPGDSLRTDVPEEYAGNVRLSEYRARLFPLDIFAEPAFLALYFPERGAYLWRQMGPLLAGTTILMLIIIACFAYTIRTILRQRRVSDLMIDFINNMTHEFKTPISTVALATEAIRRPDVLESSDRVLHFNAMIESENRRMRNQAETILQMAALEAKDYELSLTTVDVHEIIQSAVDAVALHVQHRHGTITSELTATLHTAHADPVHLANIIHNLLDNANKYSDNAPEIAVRTFDGDHGLSIRIKDHGIGLKPEDRKHVFEKYYRVPTGDRHDVKGFGLGLSYVKMMVEAHGGTIALYSQYGEGTQVEITLPTTSSE